MALGQRHSGDAFRFVESVACNRRVEIEQEENGGACRTDSGESAKLLGTACLAGWAGGGALHRLDGPRWLRSLMVMGS